MNMTPKDIKDCEKLLSSIGRMIGKTDTGDCYKCLTKVLRMSRERYLKDWLKGDSSIRTSCAKELRDINDILIKSRVYYEKLLLDF